MSVTNPRSILLYTARRYYRFNGSVMLSDWPREVGDDYAGSLIVSTWLLSVLWCQELELSVILVCGS